MPTDMTDAEARLLVRRMFDAAVAAADPARIVPSHLPEPPRGRTIVVGAGKASAAMARAFEQNWHGELSGLVVTRYGHGVHVNGSRLLRRRIPCRTQRVLARRKTSCSCCKG